MPAALDISMLPEPLRALVQSVLAERDQFCAEREAARQQRDDFGAEQRRLEQENKLLKERIRLLLLAKYGSKSEKLSDAQLSLLELEPGVTREEVAGEAAQPARSKKLPRRPAPHGRAPLPAHLPRVEEIVRVPEEQRHCPTCQCPKCCIGYDVSEVLDLKPVELFVRVIKTEKLACPSHPENGVTSAPAPARIVPGGKLSDAFLIDVLLKKYQLHQPLYRQSEAWWRDTQVEVSRSTLCDGVMAIGQWLLLVNAAQRDELFQRNYLQADETPVGVQSPDVKGRNHQAWQWQYSAPGGPVVFDFQMSRSRAGPQNFLKGYRGVLHTDAYGGYDASVVEGIIHAACWAHVRRKFRDALKLDPADKDAVDVLQRISRLYEIERQAREQNLDAATRLQLRQQHSVTEVSALKTRMQAIRQAALPGSQIAKACDYALRIWARLEVFLTHGAVEVDTNLAENAMRPLALGRKNWLHIGDEKAGPKIAAILSVLATCERLGIDAREYLLDVLPRLGRATTGAVAGLTPQAWHRNRQSAAANAAANA
jgi:transposase